LCRRAKEALARWKTARRRLEGNVADRPMSESIADGAGGADVLEAKIGLRACQLAVFAFQSMWLDKERGKVIIIDRGDYESRLGWAHEKEPRVVVRTRGRHWHQLLGAHEAYLQMASVSQLRVVRPLYTILITDSSVGQTALQTYDLGCYIFALPRVRAACVLDTAVLALRAAELSTGLVVDIGASSTRVVPVFEKHVLTHAARMCNFGGEDLTDYMLSLIPIPTHWTEEGRRIKEEHCYVAWDYKAERPEMVQKKVERSDAVRHVVLRQEVVMVPEVHFKPHLHHERRGHPSLQALIADAVKACDPQLRPLMCQNILLVGRGTLFAGLRERLAAELEWLLPGAHAAQGVRIHEAPGREVNMSAYYGAREFARSPGFGAMCMECSDMSKAEDIGSMFIL